LTGRKALWDAGAEEKLGEGLAIDRNRQRMERNGRLVEGGTSSGE
jgi:hypothetical protein